MLTLKLLTAIMLQIAVLALLLFLPAGTWRWWQAWVLLGMYAVMSIGAFGLPRGLIEERLKPPIQKGQPLVDRIVVLLLLAAYYGEVVFIPFDVFRLHLLGGPGPYGSALGLVLLAAGCWIGFLALKENAFAAPVVKHQEERGQRVIDTGVYRVVRHPMYAGAALVFLGMPLWLGSYAGALAAAIPIAVLACRIPLEEQFLRRELPGYGAYAQRTRYRLIPFLW